MIIVTLYAAMCCNFSFVIAVLLSAGFAITGFGTVFSCLAWIGKKSFLTDFTPAFNHSGSAVGMLSPPCHSAFVAAIFPSDNSRAADKAGIAVSLQK